MADDFNLQAEQVGQKEFDFNQVTSGVQYLTRGYIEYAEEVICGRALPNIYDGLKPVNRRIIVTLRNDKSKGFVKCARLAGNVLALHPHGDAAVYQAMVLMTDKNGSLAFASLEGNGNFGGVYKDDPPAAPRYTEAKLSQLVDEYFGEMNGVKMIPNFDSTMTEPEVLPISFPVVLVNSTSGIAVGFRSNMPSFNFNDVCDLVIEYITDGKCHTVIEPDFVTGGYYIRNEKELQKLMRTGSAKLKLRGKTTIVGKEIQVLEVPFGKTIQGIIKQINDKNIPAIRNAYDTDDFDHGSCFTVDCTSKARVDEALYAMYKDTDFQYSFTADMTVVKDGSPIKLGVWGIIAEWVAWRKQVLEKEYKTRISTCKGRMRESQAFMAIVNSPNKNELIKIITTQGRDAGKTFIRNNWTREEVPENLIDFVSNRPIGTYHTGGKYATDYENAQKELAALNTALSDLGAVIINQMNRLKSEYGVLLKRKTEITNTDYEFTETEDNAEAEKKEPIKFVDTSKCHYTFKDGFLKKTRYSLGDTEAQFDFDGIASDTLIAFDNRGRVLRVYCEDVPMHGTTDLGMYLPRYFNLQETEDYRITWIGRMTGQTLFILYKTGNVGFVDTTEWTQNNRRVKVVEKGISYTDAPYLGVVMDEKDMPPALIVTDTIGRLGVALTKDIKRKGRAASTRVFRLFKNYIIDSYAKINSEYELSMTLANYENYMNKMTKYEDGDLLADPSIFIDIK